MAQGCAEVGSSLEEWGMLKIKGEMLPKWSPWPSKGGVRYLTTLFKSTNKEEQENKLDFKGHPGWTHEEIHPKFLAKFFLHPWYPIIGFFIIWKFKKFKGRKWMPWKAIKIKSWKVISAMIHHEWQFKFNSNFKIWICRAHFLGRIGLHDGSSADVRSTS